MGATTPLQSRKAQPASRASYVTLDDRASVLEVLAAGARARQVADVFAAAGLAAILMDGAGRVLHVGAAALALFGRDLRLESNHLVGRDAEGNEAIETVLNGILGRERSATVDSPVVRVGKTGPLVMTAVGFADPSPVQLLRAVVIIGMDERVLRANLRALDL